MLTEIARTLLFGTTWEDKLFFPAQFEDPVGAPLVVIPALPGRIGRLAHFGKASFPAVDELNADAARGKLLHFFANHELLAMELMALMLLRFPETPAAFRAGFARTIQEEQNHLKLYVSRMRELGVDFGDFPLSRYFWDAIKDAKSPLEFVVQMSLTLEQANLDFSFYYQKAVAQVGDVKTAALLWRVYEEEIGHVKHGVTWFNRWRTEADGKTDWEAYLNLLPAPMTPRRAKGVIFLGEPRKAAGLSAHFIDELEVYGGSKGRPPQLWLYNPLCEAEIARGKPGFTPADNVKLYNLDLETLPMFLALQTDVVLVEALPRTEWLKQMKGLGVTIPEFRKREKPLAIREDKLSGLQPWGWSPEPFALFQLERAKLVPVEGANAAWSAKLLAAESFSATGIGTLFSKAWSLDFYRRWCGESDPTLGTFYADWATAKKRLRQGGPLQIKAPWGTSGTQNRKFLAVSELDSGLGSWIQKTIDTQGGVIIEPWLTKVADLSLQLEVGDAAIRIVGIRQFHNTPQSGFAGTILDAKLNGLAPDVRRFLHEGSPSPLSQWHCLAEDLGRELRAASYRGPVGIDGMVAGYPQGALFFKPVVEINPRWTMGRIAIALEDYILPGTPAYWEFLPIGERDRISRFPPRFKKGRLAEGRLCTTDPERARQVLTVLTVGAAHQTRAE